MNIYSKQPFKKDIFRLFENNIPWLITDENLNIVAANSFFYSKFMDDQRYLDISLNNFFTNTGLKLFFNNEKSGVENFEVELESLKGEKWVAKIKSLYSPFKKRFFVISLQEESLFEKGINLVSEEMNSMAFLLMGLAHEIKNPLAGIKVLVDMIECEIEEGKDIKPFLFKISRNVDRVNSMLDTFFSYAKVSNNKKDVFSVEEFLKDIELLSGYRIEKNNVNFEIISNLNKREVCLIANRDNALNLLLNLIQNAFDSVLASENTDKRISLKIFETQLPVKFNIDCVNGMGLKNKRLIGVGFSLEDNGIGMDEFEKRHIFNPFFTTKNNGIGLGMSLVAKYLKENCGEIKIDSTKGKGSKFTIVLPGIKYC